MLRVWGRSLRKHWHCCGRHYYLENTSFFYFLSVPLMVWKQQNRPYKGSESNIHFSIAKSIIKNKHWIISEHVRVKRCLCEWRAVNILKQICGALWILLLAKPILIANTNINRYIYTSVQVNDRVQPFVNYWCLFGAEQDTQSSSPSTNTSHSIQPPCHSLICLSLFFHTRSLSLYVGCWLNKMAPDIS